MRELIESRIRESSKWASCIRSGMEDELPRLDVLSDSDLLEAYDFYCCR